METNEEESAIAKQSREQVRGYRQCIKLEEYVQLCWCELKAESLCF